MSKIQAAGITRTGFNAESEYRFSIRALFQNIFEMIKGNTQKEDLEGNKDLESVKVSNETANEYGTDEEVLKTLQASLKNINKLERNVTDFKSKSKKETIVKKDEYRSNKIVNKDEKVNKEEVSEEIEK